MWFNVLKQPQLISDVGILDLSNVPEEQKDDCNRRLKAYSDKIRNMPKSLKHPPSERYVKGKIFTLKETPLNNSVDWGIREELLIDGDEDNPLLGVLKSYLYKPIPEKVACRALEIIDNSDFSWNKKEIDEDGNTWTIYWEAYQGRNPYYELKIDRITERLVHFEIYVYEHLSISEKHFWPDIYEHIGWNDAKRQIDWR